MRYMEELDFEGALEDITPLLKPNFEETGAYKDQMEFKPDIELYRTGFTSGILKVFTARDNEDLDVVGYSLYWLLPPSHNPDVRIAQCDIIYMKPEERGDASRDFLVWCMEQLKDYGAIAIEMASTPQADYSSLLDYLDFRVVSTKYSKDIV